MKEPLKKRKCARSICVITAWVFIFTFILWAAAMYGMTMSATDLLYSAFAVQQQQYLRDTERLLLDVYNDETRLAEVKSRPGGMSALMQWTIGEARWPRFNIAAPVDPHGNRPLIFGGNFRLWSWSYEFQSAVMFIDMDRNILMESGSMISVNYIPQDVWETLRNAQEEDAAAEGHVQFSLGLINTIAGSDLSDRDWSALNVRVVRITGFMDGGYIHPISLHYVANESANQAFDAAYEMARSGSAFTEFYETGEDENGPYEMFTAPPISGLDHAGLLQWQSMFDKTAEVEDAESMVTVYGQWPWADSYSAGKPVKAGSVRYDNILSFLRQSRYGSAPDTLYNFFALDEGDYSLNNIVAADLQLFTDYTGYDFDSGEFLEPDFIMLTAIQSNPLRHAVNSLMMLYLITLYIALIGAGLIVRIIKRNLVKPLDTVNKGITDGWMRLTSPDDKPMKWMEPFTLFENYEKTRETLRTNKNELTRLNTALEYAKKAEENRKQMISNITHELKTPLAIIHSYSEGLKAHIAEEKREQYLDVILAESERMDDMVLEMLDLSRLEAGKVILARDVFSLTALAQSVFEKLNIVINEKSLDVTYNFDGDCYVNADEARISQVILNFAANAVKYTPNGGGVLVKTYAERGKTGFSVENDSKPLTGEELASVWETFYRADNCRNHDGTGLGLAITKSIINLHSGECFVRNTKNGVEFGFEI